jgi:hypothetical protein
MCGVGPLTGRTQDVRDAVRVAKLAPKVRVKRAVELLLEFKRWLWDTRVKARKKRRRQERNQKRAEAAARAPKQLGLPL